MNNKGFTLVELAIVLVIIGLLVGGVLQGQELIKQAQIRNTVQQITSFDAAVNTFRAKYKELPGDITRANVFGVDVPKGGSGANVALTPDAENDGDGDGTLEDHTAGTYVAFNGEIANFWVHLSNVNLVKGEYANDPTTVVQSVINAFPESSVGVGTIALTDSGTLHWVNGVASVVADLDDTEAGGTGAVGNGLTPEEAYGIDSKIDDGQPDNGIVKVIQQYSASGSLGSFTDDANGTGSTADPDNCQSAGEYNLAYEPRSCTIKIRASS